MQTNAISTQQTSFQESIQQAPIAERPSSLTPTKVTKSDKQITSNDVDLQKNQCCFNPALEGTLKVFAGMGCAVIFTAFLPVLGVPALVGACMMLSNSEKENMLALLKEKKSRGQPVDQKQIAELEEAIANDPVQNIGFFLAFFPATAITCLHDVYNQITDATV